MDKAAKNLPNSIEITYDHLYKLKDFTQGNFHDEIKKRMEEAAAKNEANSIANKKAKEEKANKNKTNKTKENKTENKTITKVNPPLNVEMNEEEVALSADFVSNRGKLPWPIKGVICETYGEHEHPALKGFTILNSGLEICSAYANSWVEGAEISLTQTAGSAPQWRRIYR